MLSPIERRFEDNPTISEDIRAWNCHLAPAASETLLVPSWRRLCIVKCNISRSGYLPKCHDVLHLPRKVTRQPHQILRLPRKINVTRDLRHIWNIISNARSKQSHPPTSPNSAPATKSNSEVNISTENPWIASANRKTIRRYPTIIPWASDIDYNQFFQKVLFLTLKINSVWLIRLILKSTEIMTRSHPKINSFLSTKNQTNQFIFICKRLNKINTAHPAQRADTLFFFLALRTRR